MEKTKELLYQYGEKVEFEIGPIHDWNGNIVKEKTNIIGVIEIIDRFGTFEQNEEPSYDVYNKEDNTLYKHIRQSEIIKSHGMAKPEERIDTVMHKHDD